MKNLLKTLLKAKPHFYLLLLLTVCATVSGGSTISRAAAGPLTITIVNNSNWEIHHLYFSPANNDDWSANQLTQVISPGATRTLNVSWEQSSIKLIAEDLEGCFLTKTSETSGNQVWTIANDTTRNCGN